MYLPFFLRISKIKYQCLSSSSDPITSLHTCWNNIGTHVPQVAPSHCVVLALGSHALHAETVQVGSGTWNNKLKLCSRKYYMQNVFLIFHQDAMFTTRKLTWITKGCGVVVAILNLLQSVPGSTPCSKGEIIMFTPPMRPWANLA